jgi:hypothetical protein
MQAGEAARHVVAAEEERKVVMATVEELFNVLCAGLQKFISPPAWRLSPSGDRGNAPVMNILDALRVGSSSAVR